MSREGVSEDGPAPGVASSDSGGGSVFGVRTAIARRDLSSLSREKTILLAILIQLFVAAFSSFLVVGLASMYDPSAVSGEVSVGVTGDAADEFGAAASEEGLRVVTYPTVERAIGAFEDGTVDAVVESRTRDNRIAVTVTAPETSLRKTLVVVRVRTALEALERVERSERAAFIDANLLGLPPDVEASPYFGFAYTVLIPLLLFLPVFISGSVAVDSVTEEIERGTLELLRVAPVSLVDILDGKGMAMAALAPAQAALWLVLLALNGIRIANVGLLLVFTAALSVGLVAFGVGLALLIPDRQRAQLIYSLSVLLAFTAAALLPTHPTTIAARLAVDSPGPATEAFVAGYVLAGLALAVGVRASVGRVNPERL